MMTRTRTLASTAVLAGTLLLTGCSFGGSVGETSAPGSSAPAGTTCGLSGCTVVLQRGVDAKASVLGIDVQLVGVTGDQVSLRIAGQQVTVPLDGQGQASVAGFTVSVQSANDTQIVLQITPGG